MSSLKRFDASHVMADDAHRRLVSTDSLSDLLHGSRRPLLIRGGCAAWPVVTAAASGALLAEFGDVKVAPLNVRNDKPSPTLRQFVADLAAGKSVPYVAANIHTFRERFVGQLDPALTSWFDYLPEAQRPQWTWLYAGGPGSGSELHIDTMGSSAWNALASGRKEWRLLPPRNGIDLGLLPAAVANAYPDDGEEIHWTQNPGDLLVIPSGWAHEVHNHGELTVAATGNYVNQSNIDIVEAMLAQRADDRWARIARRVRDTLESTEVDYSTEEDAT